MTSFNSNLKLGGKAYGVTGSLDPYVIELTVGQIRIVRTVPRYVTSSEDPAYIEECMCVETGIGSGTIWRYGKTIFNTKDEAELGVIARQQEMYIHRKERDAWQAKYLEEEKKRELAQLKLLQEKYGETA